MESYFVFRQYVYALRVLFHNPAQFLFEFFNDIKKDLGCKKGGIVWVAGLPKSGTTLVEAILNQTDYVQGNKSVLRKIKTYPLDHEHGVCIGHFQYFPPNKRTFIKTHSHWSAEYLTIAKEFNVKIIVVVRDLRDMMISRYYHILSDKNHWMYEQIKNLPRLQGFKKSCIGIESKSGLAPIDYYAQWITNWKQFAKRNNVCFLWYESYTVNPISFIKQILSLIKSDCDPKKIEASLFAQRLKLKRVIGLKKRRDVPGRDSSTFRQGGSSWQNMFDRKTISWFRRRTKKYKHILYN